MSKTAIVCFPFAGAGTAVFRNWKTDRFPDISVHPILLPGRERRIAERPVHSVEEAVGDCLRQVNDISINVDRLVLFGHSLGAILAYETARRLAGVAAQRAEKLIVSGSPAPTRPRRHYATGLPDHEFLERVAVFAGQSHEALMNDELRELVLPTLRADVEMHETYEAGPGPALALPVTAIRGNHDSLVTAEDCSAWVSVTSEEFRCHEYEGGHMYLLHHESNILELVANSELGGGGILASGRYQ